MPFFINFPKDNNIKIAVDYRILNKQEKLPLSPAILTIDLNGIYFNKYINSFTEYGDPLLSIPTIRYKFYKFK